MRQDSSFAGLIIETMQLGGLAGMTALTMGIGEERAIEENEAGSGRLSALKDNSLPLTHAQAEHRDAQDGN
jgi:hypothetical protein